MNLARCPKKEATIQEISTSEMNGNDTGFLLTKKDIPIVKVLNRLSTDVRINEIPDVLKYNALKRDNNENIQL